VRTPPPLVAKGPRAGATASGLARAAAGLERAGVKDIDYDITV
jgi:hypothetical protein